MRAPLKINSGFAACSHFIFSSCLLTCSYLLTQSAPALAQETGNSTQAGNQGVAGIFDGLVVGNTSRPNKSGSKNKQSAQENLSGAFAVDPVYSPKEDKQQKLKQRSIMTPGLEVEPNNVAVNSQTESPAPEEAASAAPSPQPSPSPTPTPGPPQAEGSPSAVAPDPAQAPLTPDYYQELVRQVKEQSEKTTEELGEATTEEPSAPRRPKAEVTEDNRF